jgi:magnesium-transporting ATPase (P-type)
MEKGSKEHQKEKTTKMIRAWIDQFAHVMQSTDTKDFIQVLVLDPFIKYIMGQIFPYIIIAFCLFGAVLIVVILTFVVVLFRQPIGVVNAVNGIA